MPWCDGVDDSAVIVRPMQYIAWDNIQEAQLLLGDRATRKHAKDS